MGLGVGSKRPFGQEMHETHYAVMGEMRTIQEHNLCDAGAEKNELQQAKLQNIICNHRGAPRQKTPKAGTLSAAVKVTREA